MERIFAMFVEYAGPVSIIFSGIAAISASIALIYSARQSSIMSKQLISDQRAWICFDMNVVSDFRAYETGSEFDIEINVSNVGKTPALDVCTSVDVITDGANVPQDLKKFANENLKSEPQASRLVFPGESYKRPWGCTVSVDDLNGRASVSIIVVLICITYKIPHDNVFHQSAVPYCVGIGSGLMPIDADLVEVSRIRSTVWPGGFAN